MRTAVVLLIMLAAASIPGSVLPQRGVASDPAAVPLFYRANPDLAPWLDLQTAQTPLANGDFSLTGEQLAQSAVTVMLWVVLPLVAGWFRTTRAEVK